MSEPCASCPWRTGSTPDRIPGFDLCKARNLRRTVGPGDDFRPIMACHGSDEGADRPCVGYVAVEGWSNLNLRMLVISGKVELAEPEADLYPSFDAMLANIEEFYEREVL